MKYKVGDRVRIKNIDWYNENKGPFGEICPDFIVFLPSRSKYCGQIMTIKEVLRNSYNSDLIYYKMIEDAQLNDWTNGMIEGLVEESDDFEKMYMESEKRYEEEYSKGEYCHEQSFKWGFQEGYNYSHENDKLEISLKEDYQFVDENGNVINATKIVLEKKKKKEYPKSLAECLEVLGYTKDALLSNKKNLYSYSVNRLADFQQLLICRDAYWKIAGKEMGLGKPWEPDWGSDDLKWVIICKTNAIMKTSVYNYNCILAFPTPEMRDAFYENFKSEIEICKELL